MAVRNYSCGDNEPSDLWKAGSILIGIGLAFVAADCILNPNGNCVTKVLAALAP